MHINDGNPHTYQIDKEAGTGFYILVNSVSFQKYRTSLDSCDCKGFTYRRTCKHVEALRLIKGEGMANEVAEVKTKNLAEVFVSNNLASLNDQEKTEYYLHVCESMGLNPSTRPLEFMNIKGRTILYATKNCAEQLRKNNGVSVEIVSKEIKGEIFIVEVKATDKTGRTDSDVGIVTIANLRGDDLANAIMKGVTKAKNRVTFSICSKGLLDETETDTIQGAVKVPPVEMPKFKNVGHLAKDHVLEPVGDAYEPIKEQRPALLQEIGEIFKHFSTAHVEKWLLKNFSKKSFDQLTTDEILNAIARANKSSGEK